MKVLLTGHAGFVGYHILHEILYHTDWDVIGIDNFSRGFTSSRVRLDSFTSFFDNRLKSLRCDFSNETELTNAISPFRGNIDYIIHNGAESAVPRSFAYPTLFSVSNYMGTLNMLNLARTLGIRKFLYTSTDEVFGATLIPHVETSALNPSNPYSGSKAAAEMIVKSYQTSFGLPCLITRTTNMYGAFQEKEKFIKMAFGKIWDGDVVDIHTNSSGQIGSRQWLHASEQAKAILFLLTGPFVNDIFHLAGERRDNLEIAQFLADKVVGKPLRYQLKNIYEDYPGHDLHYALDDKKIREAGFLPSLTLEQGLMLPL